MSMNINNMVSNIARMANATSNIRSSELIYGTILTLEPLSVKLDTIKEPITDEFLVLGQMCRPHTVTIPHKHEYNGITEAKDAPPQGGSHFHDIKQQITNDVHDGINEETFITLEIYPKLKVNDTVLMFSFNNGQKYYIAERVII